ncbi:AAA-like domain-containing protein [Candidatus Synechococcus calcipolaris G9]|uniref:AAA-like domain-containing protein n=1 Tax=Candidatus Synechococcus calcipolaris G9 TaxID=1497997 RepID=A0ABT6F1X9_9SYNE|nr:AAA-like domain-containing protein [Candidatus Synechococcus calcipolaris]MDG2991869.1 AAA-like domain-containing protein [Candidatus Synechococcus calcipolaris G9]
MSSPEIDLSVPYQVGGSLPSACPTYVERQADRDLYGGLRAGEFCYVLNSRQMGKSSLRVQVMQRLQGDGYACAALDITKIGSQNINADQWYASLIGALVQSFQLADVFNLRSWWRDRQLMSPIHRLGEFMEQVLLHHRTCPLVIFIDEVDSLLSLPFSTDDFFAWIRSCYNQRADDPSYQRLTFALLGVATPDRLIEDKQRTPFNIGRAISLEGFQLEEATPLLEGIRSLSDQPQALLRAVLTWTGGQPFLTQKICRLLQVRDQFVPSGEAEDHVERLIQKMILQDWERQDEPEHLKTLRNRLLADEQRSGRLLGMYQKILEQGSIPLDNSPEERSLSLTGLVCQRWGQLQVFNPIYAHVFNGNWVEEQLAQLRPYSDSFQAWLRSGGQDSSRLLRGQALQDALLWANGKSLSDLDYQFFAASQDLNQREMQHTLLLERQEKQAIAAANAILDQAQHRARRLMRQAMTALAMVSLLSLGVGIVLIKTNYDLRASRISLTLEQESIDSLSRFSGQELPALVSAIAAGRTLDELVGNTPLSDYPTTRPIFALNTLLGQIHARNQWQAPGNTRENSMVGSGFIDAETIVTISEGGELILWNQAGLPQAEFPLNRDDIGGVRFHREGDRLALLTTSGMVELWQLKPDITFLAKLGGANSQIVSFRFSPDNTEMAALSKEGRVYRWNNQGELLGEFSAHQGQGYSMSYSPDGQFLATTGSDGHIRRWNLGGELQADWQAPPNQPVDQNSLTFLGDGLLATVGVDGILRLWDSNGQQRNQWRVSTAPVYYVGYDPRGYLITLSNDNVIRLWNENGLLHTELRGHEQFVNSVQFDTQGEWLISSDRGGGIYLWQIKNQRHRVWPANQESLWALAFAPDGETLATGGKDGRVRLWQKDGTFLAETPILDPAGINSLAFTSSGQQVAIAASHDIYLWQQEQMDPPEKLWHSEARLYTVAVSPDDRYLVAGDGQGMIHRLNLQDQSQLSFGGSGESIWSLSINPVTGLLASTGEGGSVKLWNIEAGTLAQTLEPNQGWLAMVRFSQDGQTLIAGGDGGWINVWNGQGQNHQQFRGHLRSILSLGLSADGQMIAAASQDRTVSLWSRSGQPLGQTTAVPGVSYGVDISATNPPVVAIAGQNDQIILTAFYPLPELLQYACDWLRDYRYQNKDVAQVCPG